MQVVRLDSYVIPPYGNRHTEPYGRMQVEHNGKRKTVRFGERDSFGRSFIVFDRKRYFFRNEGSLYAPRFVFLSEENHLVPMAEVQSAKIKSAHLEGLLNILVDHMVDEADNQNLPVIKRLMEYGFTEDDLVYSLGFPITEVRQVFSNR